MEVFAIFRAEVRIIDHVKRAALSKLLLESVTSTAPGEKLDEKLAGLTFSQEEPDRVFFKIQLPSCCR